MIGFAVLWPASGLAIDADDAWFERDEQADVAAVSTGALRFLDAPPEKPVHHHENRLTLGPDSLVDGWARLDQCHEHLDPVPLAEVVYRADGIRDLEIVSARGIGRAWIDGASVQLQDVGRDAFLCIRAESRVVHPTEDGGYAVRNGPFMRRFLDGFYPMRVSLSVDYPEDALRVVATEPPARAGVRIDTAPGRVAIDTWFEGVLRTEVRFAAR